VSKIDLSFNKLLRNPTNFLLKKLKESFDKTYFQTNLINRFDLHFLKKSSLQLLNFLEKMSDLVDIFLF